MDRRALHSLGSVGTPLLVVLIGSLLSVGAWRLLIAERKAQVVAATQEIARGSDAAISDRLGSQRIALEGLADLWARFGRRPLAEWRAKVDLLIDSRDGLSSVAWVDLDEPKRRVAVGRGRDVTDFELDVERARAYYPNTGVHGPIELGEESGPAEELGYRVFMPVRTDAGHAGMLVADVSFEELLTPLLRARAPEYAVTLEWDGRIVFRQGEPAARSITDWWHAETHVALADGATLRLVHRPTAVLAQQRLTPIPHVLLAAGILVSLLLAAVVHQWRVVSGQAHELEGSNRTLEQRGRDLETLNDELEQRVTERTDQLEDAIAELEAFNYSVSHDLRSPLGAVLNLVAILEEDYRDRIDEEGLALIERIERCASRATALLEDLLELSQTGQAVLEIEPIDTTALAREMFAQARVSEAEGEDVEFVLHTLPVIHADRALLGTVFSNLFSNALKYTRGCPKRRVTVSGRVEGGECIVEVADNGRGFDVRFAPKLFGLFERLHGNDEIEGTGVGLAMVARIMKRHGGRAWAEGELGVGARFSLALPRMGEET